MHTRPWTTISERWESIEMGPEQCRTQCRKVNSRYYHGLMELKKLECREIEVAWICRTNYWRVGSHFEKSEIFPCGSFYEAKITLMPITDKYIIRKWIYRPIILMNIDAKNLHKTSANRIKHCIKHMKHSDWISVPISLFLRAFNPFYISFIFLSFCCFY